MTHSMLFNIFLAATLISPMAHGADVAQEKRIYAAQKEKVELLKGELNSINRALEGRFSNVVFEANNSPASPATLENLRSRAENRVIEIQTHLSAEQVKQHRLAELNGRLDWLNSQNYDTPSTDPGTVRLSEQRMIRQAREIRELVAEIEKIQKGEIRLQAKTVPQQYDMKDPVQQKNALSRIQESSKDHRITVGILDDADQTALDNAVERVHRSQAKLKNDGDLLAKAEKLQRRVRLTKAVGVLAGLGALSYAIGGGEKTPPQKEKTTVIEAPPATR